MPELRLEELELELHLLAQLPVEGAERLVEQQDRRAVDERPCERDALLLAAGELGGLAVGEAAHLHHVERGRHALADLGLGRPTLLQAVGDVLGDAHVREERVGLEDRVHVAAVRRGAEHAASRDADVAGIRLFESRDHAQGRGLAAARRAEERDELTGLDRQRQVVDRDLVAVALADPIEHHRAATFGSDGIRRRSRVRIGRRGHVGWPSCSRAARQCAVVGMKPYLANVPIKPFIDGMKDANPRVQLASEIGLGRLGRPEAIPVLMAVKVPASFVAPAKDAEGPHATPNSAIIPAHIAVRSLLALNAVDECVNAIGTENSTIALWALRYMHDPKAVNGLMAAYKKTTDDSLKKQIVTTLARLYQKEVDYDGSTWWSTRPVINGPYYKATDWESSAAIKSFLTEQWAKSNDSQKQYYADLNGRMHMGYYRIWRRRETGCQRRN